MPQGGPPRYDRPKATDRLQATGLPRLPEPVFKRAPITPRIEPMPQPDYGGAHSDRASTVRLQDPSFTNSHGSVATSRPCERNRSLRIDRKDHLRMDDG